MEITDNEIVQFFKELDLNGNSFIELNELKKEIERQNLSEQYAKEIFTKVDLNKDNRICIEELRKAVLSNLF
jgi:Ca2+-binding EF-hand superfamily protein